MEWNCYKTYECELSVFSAEYGPFGIMVKSGDFSGSFVFCIERENLKDDIEELRKLVKNLDGEYKLCDMDSDSYLSFKMKKYGKLTISGIIGGSYSNNYMRFGFDADQTLLVNFINALEKA